MEKYLGNHEPKAFLSPAKAFADNEIIKTSKALHKKRTEKFLGSSSLLSDELKDLSKFE